MNQIKSLPKCLSCLFIMTITHLQAVEMEQPNAIKKALDLGNGEKPLNADPCGDVLSKGFRQPERESFPETWFHLIGGNVAKPGLTADLEAIAHAGISGIQLFHGQFGGPWPGVDPQVTCLSPQWDSMIGHVGDECRRLGLRFTMQNCPGWAMSGGPWISPENAMRHLVWSRKDVTGGKSLSIDLVKPEPNREPWRDYREVAVLAFPRAVGDDEKGLHPATVHSNRASLPWADLLACKPNAKVRIEPCAEPVWVELSFDAPVTLRSVELPAVEKLSPHRNFDPGAAIHVQAQGSQGWMEVARRELPRGNWQDDHPLTLALPESTAKAFRISFENRYPLEISSLKLSRAARIDDWQGQSGLVLRSLDRTSNPTQDRSAWIAAAKIIELSSRMNVDGKLNWDPPAGNWTILRFGHVNTGARNGPAPREGTGFECDKFSNAGAERHFAGYIGRIAGPGGPGDGGRLNGMVMDSWECHTQTWTPLMEREFFDKSGYALRQWLPALAGYVVEDHISSERFLRDWRATVNHLLVHRFFGRMAALGHERGLKISVETAIGDVSPGDILQYFGQADVPMCEFWQPNDPHWGGLESKPIAPCVSAAHIYGKPRIAAEAFTNIGLRWDEHPFMLKHLADFHLAAGLNHLVFHTYTHNPRLDVVPGTSFGAGIGTPFLRGQTWWKQIPAFTTYLARCQFLLEQGRPVADVLWYLGDELDHKPSQAAPFPTGYRFDYLNQDVLLNRLKVSDGQLTTPEGVSWKVLWLRDCPRLTQETLAKFRDLLIAGACVVGPPPRLNASLSGGAEADEHFTALVRELWGVTPSSTGDRKIGAGRLLWGADLRPTLACLNVEADVTGIVSGAWCHRKTGDADLYFIAAGRDRSLRTNASFRTQGRPEFWDPLTGTITPVSLFHRQTARTVVPLDLPASGSVFVVFRKGESKPAATRIECDGSPLVDACDTKCTDTGAPPRIQGLIPGELVQPWVEHSLAQCEMIDGGRSLLAWKPGSYRVLDGGRTVADVTVAKAREIRLEGTWTLSFPHGWGAPACLDLPVLKPWSEVEDRATRAFSGTAIYSYNLMLDGSNSEMHALLDLGQVANITEVTVNGEPVAALWTAPFRVEIASLLKPGVNRIAVAVTNTWRNRLIYDAGLPERQRKTWTVAGPAPNATLEMAGLKGPVVLHIGQVVKLTQP